MTPLLNEGQFRVLRKASDVAEGGDEGFLRSANLTEVWKDRSQPTRISPITRREERNVDLVAGRPMQREDLPEHVYHVTTNKSALEQSGHVRAGSLESGTAGLGGSHSGTVSLTLSEDIAHQLKHDIRNYAMMVQSGSREATMDLLHREAEQHNVPQKDWESVQRAHDLSAAEQRQGHGSYVHYLTGMHYNVRRRGGSDLRNPIIVGGANQDEAAWQNIHPDDIDVVKIHRDQIPQEALITSFDTDQHRHGHGLNEVRVHADIPLGRQF